MSLEAIRKKKNLTRRQLAIATGITENSIFRYERKKRIPNVNTAAIIAKALDCTVDDLIREDTDMQREENPCNPKSC